VADEQETIMMSRIKASDAPDPRAERESGSRGGRVAQGECRYLL